MVLLGTWGRGTVAEAAQGSPGPRLLPSWEDLASPAGDGREHMAQGQSWGQAQPGGHFPQHWQQRQREGPTTCRPPGGAHHPEHMRDLCAPRAGGRHLEEDFGARVGAASSREAFVIVVLRLVVLISATGVLGIQVTMPREALCPRTAEADLQSKA